MRCRRALRPHAPLLRDAASLRTSPACLPSLSRPTPPSPAGRINGAGNNPFKDSPSILAALTKFREENPDWNKYAQLHNTFGWPKKNPNGTRNQDIKNFFNNNPKKKKSGP